MMNGDNSNCCILRALDDVSKQDLREGEFKS